MLAPMSCPGGANHTESAQNSLSERIVGIWDKWPILPNFPETAFWEVAEPNGRVTGYPETGTFPKDWREGKVHGINPAFCKAGGSHPLRYCHRLEIVFEWWQPVIKVSR